MFVLSLIPYTLSHILYHQYRHYGTKFIPGQLHHDLQRMVQASFLACVLLRRKGGGKLYLYQLGTGQEEKLFSSVRTITHARNCDALEVGQRLLHAETINKIVSKHATWKWFNGKRAGAYNDASHKTTGLLNSMLLMWIFINSGLLGELKRVSLVLNLHISLRVRWLIPRCNPIKG